MQNEKKYTIFDFEKLSMASSQGRAKLRFGIFRNNPRVTVYTNVDDDKKNNYGMITAALDPVVFSTITTLIEDLADNSSIINVKYKIENMTLVSNQDSNKKEMQLVNNLLIGKDEEGVVWIGVFADGRPKFKFEFGHFPFHKFYKPDGTQMTKAELSAVAAKSMVTLLRNIYASYVSSNYEHIPPSTYGKGGNNKGQQKSYSSANDVQDDDMPF